MARSMGNKEQLNSDRTCVLVVERFKAALLDIRETRVQVPAEAIFFLFQHFEFKNNILFFKKFIRDLYVHTKRIQGKWIRTHEF